MKTPESRSGLRMARLWNTKASISIPVPATAHPISDPRMPVATPKRAGSENTPAPAMLPTTSPVRVGRLIFAGVASEASATASITGEVGTVSTIVSLLPLGGQQPGLVGGELVVGQQPGRAQLAELGQLGVQVVHVH